ncbi:MAG: hypothetical protein QW304_02680 [Thermoproteota archaeon]
MLVFSRKELYKRKDVQKLLNALKEGKINRITPKFILEEGLRYLDAEEITNLLKENVKTVLEELVEDGILVKELLETRLTCPKCGSLKASLKLVCPACNSPSIKKGEAVEHVACGHVDFETVFKNPEGGMICLKCNSPISRDEDYRRLGFLYKCLVCGEFSKAPRRILTCGECESEYNEEDGIPFEVYGYSVNEGRKEIIEVESLDLSPVIKNLRTAFWEAETSVILKGKSGLEHPFTLMAYRPGSKNTEETNIMVDVVLEKNGVDEVSVISLFSKILDFNVKHAVLIGVPSISEEARRLGESYKISVLECSKMEEVVETLWNTIKPIVEEEASKTFMEVAGILETSQALKNLLKEEAQDIAKH